MSFLQGLCIFSIILLSNGLTFANLTPEQKAEAIRLFRETQNFAEVARKLNTSRENVRKWVRAEEKRTGQQIVLQQHHFTPEQKEAVRLFRETQNYAEVARRLNTSEQDVRRWVRDEEERTGQQIVPQQLRQGFTPEQKAEAVRLFRETHSFSEVGRKLNIDGQNVRNWVQRINDIIEKIEEYGFSNEIQETIKSDIPSFTMVGNIEDVIKHIEETREICTEALIEDSLT